MRRKLALKLCTPEKIQNTGDSNPIQAANGAKRTLVTVIRVVRYKSNSIQWFHGSNIFFCKPKMYCFLHQHRSTNLHKLQIPSMLLKCAHILTEHSSSPFYVNLSHPLFWTLFKSFPCSVFWQIEHMHFFISRDIWSFGRLCFVFFSG